MYFEFMAFLGVGGGKETHLTFRLVLVRLVILFNSLQSYPSVGSNRSQ